MTNNPGTDTALCIQVDQLGKRFNREWIFRNLTHTFKAGETYAITGPNGAGKSTLLHVLWGQVPPSTGTLAYHQHGPVAIEHVYRHIAVATPYLDLIEEFTLAEQVRFHFKLKPRRDGLSDEAMIERMYLQHARDKFIANFSSGMKQRVKLALAFYTAADVVFLDEPGTNLDQQAFSWYLDQLRALPARTLVFIASNQPAEYPADAVKIDIMRYK